MITKFLHTNYTQLKPENIAAGTHVGLVREHNEDGYLYITLPGEEASILVVTDGMGGHDGGELASFFTTESLSKIWRNKNSSSDLKLQETEDLLIDCIQECNRKVFSINDKLQISRAMGTTVTAAIVTPGKITIAHVGDSRAYLMRGGKLKQLTEDQTWVAKMVKLGNLSPAEAENHPLSHLLSNCLGASANLQISVTRHKRKHNDRYLLCSDGLYGGIPKKELHAIMKKNTTPQKILNELIYTSLKNGGKDNITGIVAFDI